MAHYPTRCLIVLLALLQLVAPLVHAHLGKDFSPRGIHVPGLEFVGAEQDPSWLRAAPTQSRQCGFVVGIVEGINHEDQTVERENDIQPTLVATSDSREAYPPVGAQAPPSLPVAFQTVRLPAAPRAPPHSRPSIP